MLTISSASSQEFPVLVAPYLPVSVTTPTADSVYLAFLNTPRNPVAGDWQVAAWYTSLAGTCFAQIKLGPQGFTLAVGYYYVWVRIDDASGQIVAPVGMVRIA